MLPIAPARSKQQAAGLSGLLSSTVLGGTNV